MSVNLFIRLLLVWESIRKLSMKEFDIPVISVIMLLRIPELLTNIVKLNMKESDIYVTSVIMLRLNKIS